MPRFFTGVADGTVELVEDEIREELLDELGREDEEDDETREEELLVEEKSEEDAREDELVEVGEEEARDDVLLIGEDVLDGEIPVEKLLDVVEAGVLV